MIVVWRYKMNGCEVYKGCRCWECSDRICYRYNCKYCEEKGEEDKLFWCKDFKEKEME